MAAMPERPRGWRDVFVVEGSGLRTGLGVLVPVVIGQLADRAPVGVVVAVGALQLSLVDMQVAPPSSPATLATLMWGVLGCVVALFAGGLVADMPVIPAMFLMFALAFPLRMLSIYGEVMGNLGFIILLTYASAQSVVLPRGFGMEHLGWFALGTLWAVVLTLLLWRTRRLLRGRGSDRVAGGGTPVALPRSGGASWWRVAAANMTLDSPDFRHALRTAFAAAIATVLGRYVHPTHGFWLILTVLVVLKPDYEFTRRRTLERMTGSVVGGLAAMALLPHIHGVVLLDLLLGVLGVLAFSHLRGNYGLYVLFLTPFVVLLAGIAVPGDTGLAAARIQQTLIGGTLGFAVSFLFGRSLTLRRVSAA
jgi:hypothetical protein